MQIDFLDFLEDIFQSQYMNYVWLKPPYENLSQIDMELRKNICEEQTYEMMREELEKRCEPNTLYTFQDDLKLNYVMFRFPEAIYLEKGYVFGSIGPFLYQNMNNLDFYELLEKLQIPPAWHNELSKFFDSLPIIQMAGWSSCLIVVGKYLFENGEDFQLKDVMSGFQLKIDCPEYPPDHTSSVAMQCIEERYQQEEDLMYALQYGDVKKATILYNQINVQRMIPRSTNELRNKKDLMFVLNTLCRKAVQRSNIHPLHIDELSSRLAIRIESATNTDQLDKIASEMLHKYCNLVKNYSLSAYSLLIQKVINYIDFNYAEILSLNKLARMLAVNASYLSSLFKKEVKMTLTEYINMRRIHQSLILLNTTSLPIQSIATQCGFGDVNYFTRIFKKLKGMVPREYRDFIRASSSKTP